MRQPRRRPSDNGVSSEPRPFAPIEDNPRQEILIVEDFSDVALESAEEWRVDGVLPRQGVAVLYGDSQTFKSFLALDLGLYIAAGWDWWGRKTEQAAAIYIAAEGSGGVRKRIVGLKLSYAERLKGSRPPLKLISVALNLGTGKDDLGKLVATIKSLGVVPGLIIIDTLAQSLGGADENGLGMTTFLANATALANLYKSCVLAIHHIGLSDDKRERGHSSLKGGADVRMIAQRKGDELQTTITVVQKLKDDAADFSLTAHLARVVVTHNSRGGEVSTLIVSNVEDGGEAPQSGKSSQSVTRARRLLRDVVALAIDEAGEMIPSFPAGPTVRAVKEDAVRRRYFVRIAEKAEPGEDPKKLADRIAKAFKRTVVAALNAKELMARESGGERFLWLP